MKLGQGPSEADFGQDPGRFVRQDGPESQDLLIPRRGNANGLRIFVLVYISDEKWQMII